MSSILRNPRVPMHASIFLFGFTAILGQWAALSAWWLVWWRLGLSALGFLILLFLFPKPQDGHFLPWRKVPPIVLAGLVLGLHWIFFFGSIRLSNVAVAVVMLATSPFLTALLEPLVRRRRLRPRELALGALTLAGIWLIYQVEARYWEGMVVGLLSAAFSGLYGILNKGLVSRHNLLQLNFYQMTSAWLLLGLFSPLYLYFLGTEGFQLPTWHDFACLAGLAFVCTNLGYVLSMTSLRSVSVFEYVLAVNLEPIYSILLAWFIFGEDEVLRKPLFLLGTALVIGSVFVAPVLEWARGPKSI